MNCIIPDTSAVIISAVTKVIRNENIEYPEVIVPEAVVSELEHQANNNRKEGFEGLRELQRLQELQEKGKVAVSFKGKRPSKQDIQNAKNGEIDGIIRDIAKSELGTLLTNDKVQAETAKAQGIPVYYVEQPEYDIHRLKFERYFDDETMSIHLKENVVPMAKKGKPGHIEFVKLSRDFLTKSTLEEMVDELLEREKHDNKTFLESKMDGSMVIQSDEYRISIAYPPFSEAYEITVIKPVVHMILDDYNLPEKILDRIKKTAEGILISGSPGAGKSTFVQAIANFYSGEMNKIVKTMETPRDLQLPDTITQYSPLGGNMENTADVLLLVRPDYTIYDELRKDKDFTIFADLRLAGVGMIGVVHATRPIDAIQRIASRVELGVIPSVVDTSIYIEDGKVKSVYKTEMVVKVPTGMKDSDLARPVIEVRDFETNDLKNEIYTYGEQTIVMDVDAISKNTKSYIKSSADKIAEKEIFNLLRAHLPKKTKISVKIISKDKANVYIPEKLIPKIIGKNGKRISNLEGSIGIKLNILPIKAKVKGGKVSDIKIRYTDAYLIIVLGPNEGNSNFNVSINGEFLFTGTTSKKGDIKLRKTNEFSKRIMEAEKKKAEINAIKVD